MTKTMKFWHTSGLVCERIEAKGWSRADVAREVSVSTRTLRRFLNEGDGETETIVKLLNLTGCDPDEAMEALQRDFSQPVRVPSNGAV